MLVDRERGAKKPTQEEDADRLVRAEDEREHVPARACHASAPNTRPRGGDGRDTLDDAVEVRDNVMLGDAHDMPAQRGERAVTRGIETRAPVMGAAVDLDD